MAERVAVLLPCLNEAAAVGQTIAEFRTALPEADIYVFDNGSTDKTAEVAGKAGAIVRSEPQRGKGHVVRRMFADVEADVYVLVDGDATYDPSVAPAMIERLHREQLDMVVGARNNPKKDYRPGHFRGNRFFSSAVALLFGRRFNDVFSGYRVLSRRLVKSFPALARGFDVEVELSIHVLELRLPAEETSTSLRLRPKGSVSKLGTTHHGLIILARIAVLFMQVRPFIFFGSIATALFASGILSGYPVIAVFLETGQVPYLPRAVLAASLMILSSLSLICGLILHSTNQARLEMKRMHYLKAGNKTRLDDCSSR